MHLPSTRSPVLSKSRLAAVLAASLILALVVARASACGRDASHAPMPASANGAPAVNLGACPRDANGLDQNKAYLCGCPVFSEQARVFGSDIYAENSGICSAGVHAGMLKQGVAGRLLFHVVASPSAFKGVIRNGITSEAWPQPASAAFQFERLREFICSLELGSFA